MHLLRKNETVLISAWVIVQFILYKYSGINSSGEAIRIIREAGNWIDSRPFSSPAYYSYFTEIFLVYISLKAAIGFWPLILFQLLLNLAALLVFYRSLKDTYRSGEIALTAGLLLLCCWPYQLYNFYIYTESVFFSLVILFYSLILKKPEWNRNRTMTFLLLGLLLCVTRPTGCLILLAGVTCVLLYHRHFTKKKRVFLITALWILMLLFVDSLLRSGAAFNLLKPFLENHVICNVPGTAQNAAIPGNQQLPELLKYLATHPLAFLKLASLRSAAFFGLTRPWYSLLHNIFLVVYFYGLYVAAMAAVIKWRKKIPPSLTFTLMTVFLFWVTVICSCDEWSNRFFLTLTPLLLAAAGFLFMKKENKGKTY